MEGVHTGVSYGQHDRVDELNTRIQNRQFSDKPLAPNFSSRPVVTKYSRFQIADRRAPYEEEIRPVETHSLQTNFSPATQRGPPATMLQNIDLESALRNQNVAFQRNCVQSTFVPDSNSELYKVRVHSTPGPNPHPSLFYHPPTQSVPREAAVRGMNIGKDLFNNSTRTQLRAL
jgi:hypothetical protein